ADREVAGVSVGGQEARGLGRGRLNHDRDRDAAEVERDPVPEDDEQQEGQHAGDEERARIPTDLERLLPDQGADPSRSAVHAAPPPTSKASTNPMNASSRVGSAPSSRRARSFRSSGDPSAITFPL